MIGQSKVFLLALSLIERIAKCDVPVLIDGETGTGKELAARAIHYGSARRDFPFVPLNCGAIPDALIENELFGHQRGAYTGAARDQAGLIQHAHHGTLFLDEIDALSPKGQVTLLRFLQDSQYRPLGGPTARSADVRILAASNADLGKLAETGAFRLDLLFRLKILHLEMPPLRERSGDAALLAASFIELCGVRFGLGEKTLSPATVDWFERYTWPGNVRELENFIYREYLLTEGRVIDIPLPPKLDRERRIQPDRRNGEIAGAKFGDAKLRAIAEFERQYLLSMLAAADGNVTHAAKLSGKERRTFGKLLKKHGIEKSHYRSS